MYNQRIEAGTTAVIDNGTQIRYVSCTGPGAVLIEGTLAHPGTGWSPAFATTSAVVTAFDESTTVAVQ